MKFRNASDDVHPLHLHRHSFELTRIGGKPTAGVIKDVVMLGGFSASWRSSNTRDDVGSAEKQEKSGR